MGPWPGVGRALSPATLAVQQSRGRPRSRLYQIAHRISGRMEPRVADAFLRAIRRLESRIDEVALLSALASRNLATIQAAVRAGELGVLLTTSGMTNLFQRTAVATGQANAEVLSGVMEVQFSFRAVDPNAVMFAREQSAQLVVEITDDLKEAIRIVVATGAQVGLTPVQQATAIREIVGLPSIWADAPLNFAEELRAGRFRRSRLLHDPRLPPRQRRGMRSRVIAEIEERLEAGTADEAWITEQQRRYAENLRSRRALNIARTESIRSANFGQRESWRQARRDNVLPETATRHWIVTPDDRLRETHAAVPGMNPDGVPIDGGVYDTPLGPSSGPPLETNCRCSEGLTFPGLEGIL